MKIQAVLFFALFTIVASAIAQHQAFPRQYPQNFGRPFLGFRNPHHHSFRVFPHPFAGMVFQQPNQQPAPTSPSSPASSQAQQGGSQQQTLTPPSSPASSSLAQQGGTGPRALAPPSSPASSLGDSEQQNLTPPSSQASSLAQQNGNEQQILTPPRA